MSPCQLAIIADDLSGALDASAPFAARGADARVIVSLEALTATLDVWQGQGTWPAVIAVNTESRHLRADEAALRVSKAVRLLTQVRPQQWFKKVDSTLRGQVVAECRALQEAIGYPLLLAPAVPAQGRIVRNAEVWVDGVSLANTAYQQDARSSPLWGPIDDAFAAGGLALQRYRLEKGNTLPDESCIVDASSDAELAALYDGVLKLKSSRVMAGAAGLAMAIAQRRFGTPCAQARSLCGIKSVLYAVGSRAPRAAEQLEALCQQLPNVAIIEACATSLDHLGVEVCVIVPSEDGTVRTAIEVADAMAAQVAGIISAWHDEDEHLQFLTGGDIAMAVLSQQGARYITVETEWSPGVALGCLDGDAHRRVMTKAGGFGDSSLLVRLHQQLNLSGESN